MTSDTDRGVNVYHALQKGKTWYAFVVLDISDKCSDVASLKNEIRQVLQKGEHAPVEEYKGALFIRGDYDSQTLESLRKTLNAHLPHGVYQEHQGDYFRFLSRYNIWDIIDSQRAEAR